MAEEIRDSLNLKYELLANPLDTGLTCVCVCVCVEQASRAVLANSTLKDTFTNRIQTSVCVRVTHLNIFGTQQSESLRMQERKGQELCSYSHM